VLVACKRDGNAVLQASRTHHGNIDLLLTDIEMPTREKAPAAETMPPGGWFRV
jgi:CheY-like chemotaxis protein